MIETPEGTMDLSGMPWKVAEMRGTCPVGQHVYCQGVDGVGFERDQLRKLLYCARCGDIIKFELARIEE